MFIIHTVHDTILIPAHNLTPSSTKQAIFNEIDQRYPNRVLMDVGLVIGRYHDDALEHVSHGVCVAGQAGAHYRCSFRLIVFRPFVEEVCLGRLYKSTAEGIYVTTGFFADIFIPAYWMLRPSTYEESSGLWVWTPDYGDDDDDDDGEKEKSDENGKKETTTAAVKLEQQDEEKAEAAAEEEETRYEMELGSEIRFKVKSIHFARITNSAKGRQAVLSSQESSTRKAPPPKREESGAAPPQKDPPVRKRSSSVGLDEDTELPPTFHIVASICEDGLGLTSWWGGGEEEDDAEEEEGAGGQGDEEEEYAAEDGE